MRKATKRIGLLGVALSGFVLAGCQTTPIAQVEPEAGALRDTHAHTVTVLSDELDLYLSQSSRNVFLKQMLDALESEKGSEWQGRDPRTYAKWIIRVQPLQWQTVEVKHPSVELVNMAHDLQFVDIPYHSNANLNIRSEPGLNGKILGVLQKGEVFNAMAKVMKEPWLLVEQKGLIKGYVHSDYAQSNVITRDILSTQPNSLVSTLLPESQMLDASSDMPEKGLHGEFTCRYLDYQLRNDNDDTAGTLKACRKQQNVWYIEAPAVKG
ncbi:SH3 domain-containing protein [Photobacterium japonica]|uniref:SH3 domain-containing protein n=1 Tax=Photobacterium japonica TaxID=2910235 RepID=UPI003D0D34DB